MLIVLNEVGFCVKEAPKFLYETVPTSGVVATFTQFQNQNPNWLTEQDGNNASKQWSTIESTKFDFLTINSGIIKKMWNLGTMSIFHTYLAMTNLKIEILGMIQDAIDL